MINLISFLKRIKRSLCGLRDDCLFHLYRNLFRHASLQSNKIIFNNFNGRGYGDNPKYIAEELLRREMPYDLVWVVNRKQDSLRCQRQSERSELEVGAKHTSMLRLKSLSTT